MQAGLSNSMRRVIQTSLVCSTCTTTVNQHLQLTACAATLAAVRGAASSKGGASTTRRRSSPAKKRKSPAASRKSTNPVSASRMIQLPFGQGLFNQYKTESALATETVNRSPRGSSEKHSLLPHVELSRDKKGVRFSFNESSLEGMGPTSSNTPGGSFISTTTEVPLAWLEDNDCANFTGLTHQRLRVPTLPIECDKGAGAYAAPQYLEGAGGIIESVRWKFGDGSTKVVLEGGTSMGTERVSAGRSASTTSSSSPSSSCGVKKSKGAEMRRDFFQETQLIVRVKTMKPTVVMATEQSTGRNSPPPTVPSTTAASPALVTPDSSTITPPIVSSTPTAPAATTPTLSTATAAVALQVVTFAVPLFYIRMLNPAVVRVDVGVANSNAWLTSVTAPQIPLPKLWSSSDKDFAGPGVKPLEAKFIEGAVLPKEVVTTNYFGASSNTGSSSNASSSLSSSSSSSASHSRRKALHSMEKFGFALITDKSLQVSHKKSYQDNGAHAGYEEMIHMRARNHEQLLHSMFGVLKSTHYGTYSTWRANVASHVAATGVTASTLGVTAKSKESGKKADSDDTHLDGAWDNCWLDLHTDNSYFHDAPRVQGFACLASHPTLTTGGYTTLCDGFKVASIIHRDHPWAFKLLSEVPIAGQYVKEGSVFVAHRPAFSIDPELKHFQSSRNNNKDSRGSRGGSNSRIDLQSGGSGSNSSSGSGLLLPPPGLKQVTFNNADRMPFRLSPQLPSRTALEKFYQAYALLHKTIHDPKNFVKFLLKPGSILCFDNHRCLHGRTEFSGPRVMGGAYVSNDDYKSSVLAALTPSITSGEYAAMIKGTPSGLVGETFSWADVTGGEQHGTGSYSSKTRGLHAAAATKKRSAKSVKRRGGKKNNGRK